MQYNFKLLSIIIAVLTLFEFLLSSILLEFPTPGVSLIVSLSCVPSFLMSELQASQPCSSAFSPRLDSTAEPHLGKFLGVEERGMQKAMGGKRVCGW